MPKLLRPLLAEPPADGPAPATTYRQLLADCPALEVSLLGDPAAEPGSDWVSAAELPFRVAELIEAEAGRIEARHGARPRPHVAASRLLHHYLWSVCLLHSGPWYLGGVVPQGVQPWLEARTGRFALALPESAPTGDGSELREVLAARLGPVLAAFQPYVKRGPRALWGMAADDLASGLWYLGRMRDEEERAVALAEALLPGDTPPFPGAADFRRLPGTAGRSHLTRTRLGCCLYYAIAPAEACLTCPRTSDAERVRRLEL
ncbi:hypothetical protein CFP65_6217 [Kitasatospora sp. MMS16-BH015]|uniref:(2Fe-2S)-binding protein n=1 Tax=Kitasatospora sp. MMS16-BH015 TaxID=2018025 RepID=UPI000CA1602A|nr:(2Fe-2S)-binding protein [Kitasatospora sp. MMS16-BH015]AUG80882.1 hypothetical protein CFP65_6217 [Kitasatospora sp. MMS16-BH015]